MVHELQKRVAVIRRRLSGAQAFSLVTLENRSQSTQVQIIRDSLGTSGRSRSPASTVAATASEFSFRTARSDPRFVGKHDIATARQRGSCSRGLWEWHPAEPSFAPPTTRLHGVEGRCEQGTALRSSQCFQPQQQLIDRAVLQKWIVLLPAAKLESLRPDTASPSRPGRAFPIAPSAAVYR